jgi:hypothetical protein
MKTVKKSALSFLLLVLPLMAGAQSGVEVTLIDKLDEPRGFCLDTLGYQTRARPEEGLQTHSCYSYQGQLAIDQAFDADQITEGKFRLIEFDLCMTLTGTTSGSKFALEPCSGSDLQSFEHKDSGKVMANAAPGNCVTAGEGPSRHGGGGEPVHLIRDLTLEVCDATRDSRQQWRLRTEAD